MASLLCVDDNPVVLHTTERILQKAGYDVFTAETVADAFRLLQARNFDLLLLDRVPHGGWLTAEAKRMNPSVRIALCTGDAECGDLPLVDAVWYKPLLPTLLLRNISELLATLRAA